MRDPTRLNKFYSEMRRIHQQYFPDWRFGQLMSNFFGWAWNEKETDPFFPEEDRMLQLLIEYAGETK